jgi:hypothetical protein
MDILSTLLEHGKNLKVIVVPPSVYEQTSERVKSYLKDKRVSLEKGEARAGRPHKYSEEDIKKIIALKNQGTPIIQISKKLDIPRRTVYYLLEKEP